MKYMKNASSNNILGLLAELRNMAQGGLHYATNPFDRERYQRLLELAAGEYSDLTGLSKEQLIAQFTKDIGHNTAKVGVIGAVYSDEGHILLIKRPDSRLWCMPCGMADMDETVEECVQREVKEETGLEVQVDCLVDVFSILAGNYGLSHTAYCIMYHCIPTGGELTTSLESEEVGYYNHMTITNWFQNYAEVTQRAYQFWLERGKGKHVN